MELNCKEGDLATLVRSAKGNEGKIVRCVRFYGRGGFKCGASFEDVWIVESPFGMPDAKARANGGDAAISDSWLRPLRDSDGEDEVLRLVGRPLGVPQAA